MSWAKWTRQNTFFTLPGRVTLIRHACPALRELTALAAAPCREKYPLHVNLMRKKQTDTTRLHFHVFSTTNCDTHRSCRQDINSTSYPELKVIIWMPCEGHSLTEEWSVDKEPIDRLANKPQALPVNPQPVSQASPTSTPPPIHVLIPPTAPCCHHWLHNNLHWLSLRGLNHPWMMDEFAEWVDSFFFFFVFSCQ